VNHQGSTPFDDRVQLAVDVIGKIVEPTDGRRDGIDCSGQDRPRAHGQQRSQAGFRVAGTGQGRFDQGVVGARRAG